MIDHIVAFVDELDAKDNPIIGQYYITAVPDTDGQWNGSCCIPNLFAWRPADNTEEAATDPAGNPITVTIRHPIDDMWRLMIALPEEDLDIAAMPECEVVADRDKAAAREDYIIKNLLPPGTHIEPTFQGSEYFIPGSPRNG